MKLNTKTIANILLLLVIIMGIATFIMIVSNPESSKELIHSNTNNFIESVILFVLVISLIVFRRLRKK